MIILAAFSIGLSRIVLNVHNPTDVAAGFFVWGYFGVIGWYRFILCVVTLNPGASSRHVWENLSFVLYAF